MKKMLTVILLTSIVFGAFAGGRDDGESEEEQVVLRLADWNEAARPWEDRIYEEFTAQTGVGIEVLHIPDGYDQKLITMTAGGNPPDLMLFWDLPRYVESGLVMDITDLVERDNFKPEGKYDIISSFEMYKDRYYGISEEITTRAIYYNKDVFDRYGVPYPEAGWTWDEFIDICNDLTQGEGEDQTFGYIALAGHTYLMQQYIWTAGGDIISPDGSRATGYLDSPGTVKAVGFYKDLFDISAQTVQPSRLMNLGEQEFMSGKVAMMDNGGWPVVKFQEMGLNFGTVVPPVPNRGDAVNPVVHSSAHGISSKSEHVEESWNLLKFTNGDFAQRQYGSHAFPAIKAFAEELGYYDDPHQKTFAMLSELSSPNPCFTRNPKYWEADAEFAAALEEILLNDAPIKKTLSEAAARMDKILRGD